LADVTEKINEQKMARACTKLTRSTCN